MLWLQIKLFWLTIIRFGMVVASVLAECDAVLAVRSVNIEVTISIILAVGLHIPGASKPPRSTICCTPCFSATVGRVHGGSAAQSTTMVRAGDIDDEVGCPERFGRFEKGLPICSRCWSEELGAYRATVLLRGSAYLDPFKHSAKLRRALVTIRCTCLVRTVCMQRNTDVVQSLFYCC